MDACNLMAHMIMLQEDAEVASSVQGRTAVGEESAGGAEHGTGSPKPDQVLVQARPFFCKTLQPGISWWCLHFADEPSGVAAGRC